MIVSPTTHAIDLILDKFDSISDQVKILRIGHSLTRTDLNQKYALEVLKEKDDPQAAEKVQAKLEEAQVIITAVSSLRQNSLERSLHTFDTVIIDDASLVNEADCLAALRHGASRLIMLGNSILDQSMFLLRTQAANKSLYNRISKSSFMVMTPPEIKV